MNDKRAENLDIYARLNRYLEGAGAADERTLFFNWGYHDMAGEESWLPAGAQPPSGVNALHIRLVLELIGGVPLDGKTVLDIGCGRGGALKVIAERFQAKKLTGIDISPDNIAFCQRRLGLPKGRFQVADACQLPYAEASFDAVLNLESSGAYADVPAFLAEVARVLRPGGVFLFGDVLPSELAGDIETVLAAHGLTPLRRRSATRPVLAARAQAASVEARLFDERRLRESDAGGRLGQFMESYRAGEGSAIDRAMREGALTYELFQFVKQGQGAAAHSDAAAERLRQRDRIFHDLLAHRSERRLQPEFGKIDAKQEASALMHERSECVSALASGENATEAAEGGAWFPFGEPDMSARVRVFALPHAGGGASVYRDWLRALGPEIQLCPLQLPGREHRIAEAPYSDAGAMADACLGAISPHWDRPFILLGHSLGARIAFEMAVRLKNYPQARFLGLIAAGCPAPDIPTGRRVSDLPAGALQDELRKLGGTAEEILRDARTFSAHESAIRADFSIGESYLRNAGETIAAPILTIAAEADGHVSAAAVRGWERFGTGMVRHVAIPGGHFFIRGEGAAEARAACKAFISDLLAPFSRPSGTGHADAGQWLPFAPARRSAALRLFCLAFAGGSASYFHSWLKEMPAAVEVCPIELPGRGTRFSEPPATSTATLIPDMALALRGSLDRPFALFGHSLGALNAFLLARHLWQEEGIQPVHLFVSGRRAPHRPVRRPFRHVMADDELIGELRGLGGMAPEILRNGEMLRIMLPLLRADFRMTELYAHQDGPALPFPLTAFTGDSDPEVPPEEMAHWRQLAGGGFALEVLEGGHFYLSSPRERRRLLQSIGATLALGRAA